MLNYIFKYASRFTALTLLGGFISGAAASEKLDSMHIVLLDTKPYAFTDSHGNQTGYFYDIAEAILAEDVINPKTTIASPQRIVRDLPRGAFDCIIAVNSKFISETFTFIADTGLFMDVGIIPRQGITLEHYEDLSDKSIAVVKATTFYPRFDTDDSLQKILTPNYKSSAKMLHAKRVDAAAGALSSLLYAAKTIPDAQVEFGKPLVFNSLNIWFSCNKDYAAKTDTSRITQKINALKESGRLQEIQDSYLK